MSVNTLVKRPFIVLVFCLVMLAVCVVYYMLPVFDLLLNISSLGDEDVYTSLVYSLNLAFKLFSSPKPILLFFLAGLLVSLIGGLFFSGYFSLIDAALEDRRKFSGVFSQGVKRNFLKLSAVNIIVLAWGLIIAIFIAVASVPSLVVTRAALDGKPGYELAAVFIDTFTAFAAIIMYMFYRVYSSLWYPAIVLGVKTPFRTVTRVTDGGFFRIGLKLLAVDAVFALCQVLFILAGNSPFILAANWAFSSIYLPFAFVYTFAIFRSSLKAARW